VNPTDLVISGPLLLATGVALLAGFISFASPCVVPLVPGYLAYLAGLVGAEAPRVEANEVGSSTVRGGFLVLAYCLGLGLPFVVLALGARWALGVTKWLRTHARQVQIFGGVLLILVGIALVTGLWGEFVGWLRYSFVDVVRLPL